MLRPLVIHHDSHSDIRSGSRVRLLVTALLLAVLGLVVTPAAPASASESGTIHSLVNQARASAGLAGLNRNGALDQVAANWANQLAASGVLAHNPSYSAQIPGGWTNAGENVAQGQPTGAAMHDAWMASSGHRQNILGGFTDVGIAFIVAGGTTWGVEVFAAYPGSGAAAPAPAPAPRAAAPSAAEQQAAQLAAQQAAEAAAAAATVQAAADARMAAAAAEQTRVDNRVSADRLAATMTAATPARAAAVAGYTPSPGSLVAVALAVLAVVPRMVARGPFRAAITLS